MFQKLKSITTRLLSAVATIFSPMMGLNGVGVDGE